MPVATVGVQSARKSQLRGLGPCPQKGILSNVLGVTGSLPNSVGFWSSHRWSFSTPEDEQRHSSGLRLEEGQDREPNLAAQGFTDYVMGTRGFESYFGSLCGCATKPAGGLSIQNYH